MNYPRILTRYILRQLVGNVVLAWTLMSILVLLFIVLKMAQFLEKINIDGSATIYVIPALLPQALFFALPISALIGSVLTFGRLNAEGEILGIRAAGGRPLWLALPCLVLGLALSLLAWPMADQWMDMANNFSRARINAAAFEQIRKSYRPGNVVTIPLSGSGRVCTVAVQETVDGRQPINMSIFRGFEVTYLGYAANKTQLEMTLWAENCRLEFVQDPAHPDQALPRLLRFDLDNVTFTTLSPAAAVESVVRFQHRRFELPLSNESFEGFSLIASLSDIRKQRAVDEAIGEEARAALAAEPLLIVRSQAEIVIQNASGVGLGFWDLPAQATPDPFQHQTDLAPDVPARPFLPRALLSSVAQAEFAKQSFAAQRAVLRKDLEYGRKIATIFSPVFLMLLGLGLGLLVRRQSPFVGFIIGLVGYGLLFYPLGLLGRSLTMQFGLPAIYSQFLPNLLLGLAGLLLIRWQTSARAESLTRFWSALRERFRRRPAASPATPGNALAAGVAPYASAPVPRRWFRRRVLEGHILGMFLTPFLGTLCGVLLMFITLDVMENIEHINRFIETSALPDAHRDLLPLGQGTAIRLVCEYMVFNALGYILTFNGITVVAAAVFALTVMQRARETLIVRAAGGDLRRQLVLIPLVGFILSLSLSALQEFALKSTLREQNWVYERMKGKSARVAQAQTRLFRATVDGRPVDYILDVGRYHGQSNRALDFHLREFRPGEPWPIEYFAPLALWRGDATGHGGRWDFPASCQRCVRSPATDDPRLLESTRGELRELALPFSPDPFEIAEAELNAISLVSLWRMEPHPAVAAEFWGRVAAWLLIPGLLFWIMPLQLKTGWHPAKGAGLGGLIAIVGIGLHYLSLWLVPAVFALSPAVVPVFLFGSHGLLLLGGGVFYWKTMET